jgi:glucan biosynthesis protein
MSDSPVPSVSLDRRRFLASLAALAALPVMNAAALPLLADPRPFSLDILRERAKQLAAKPFQAPRKSASQALRDLNQQQQEEVDKRIELETTIAKEEANLEQEKLVFIEKEKAC